MTTQAPTIHEELCPGCDQADGAYWVDSAPTVDTWMCRHCGTEWAITVSAPGG